ncbi:glycosyltransferase family 2 protein [Thiomicrospira microaerophila]|uniref:glycosyltransferase family 2 protein n=1 Tax=Thiomicrospira microaerophila TaxID=406020 RepID=UPI00200FCF53|nr:glycosyltransferase family 2 protein [Thiomicrospira microaerophila]UQB42431.1 glycosyltransferase family 2 protein [Thiomicrospira microaerophila]
MNRQTISVCIITFNEADRIERCLRSVSPIADEIIVFDSGSTDGTLDIVRRYTDKVWQTNWPGFGVQKQRALEQACLDWVLFVDADEALDSQAQQSLLDFKQCEVVTEVGFKIKWGVVRHGKLLRFGRSARSPLRLVRREGAFYSPDIVHEKLNHAPGKIGRLKGLLLHYTSRDYGHALEKSAKYAWLGSQKYYSKGKRNHSLLLVVLRAWWTFFLIYILRGGFLDGRIGFIVAVGYMQTNFNKHAGLLLLSMDADAKRKNDVD